MKIRKRDAQKLIDKLADESLRGTLPQEGQEYLLSPYGTFIVLLPERRRSRKDRLEYGLFGYDASSSDIDGTMAELK